MLEHVGTCWNINMLEQQRKAICKAEEVNYIITQYIYIYKNHIITYFNFSIYVLFLF